MSSVDSIFNILLSSSIDPLLYFSGHLYNELESQSTLQLPDVGESILKISNTIISENKSTLQFKINEQYSGSIDTNYFMFYLNNTLSSPLFNTFDYLKFNSVELLSKKEIDSATGGLTANIKPFYNYYSKNYEDYVVNSEVNELEVTLPNFYSLNNCIINSASSKDTYNVLAASTIDPNLLRTSIESYFDEYPNATPPINFLSVNKVYKTVILPDSSNMFYSNVVLDKQDIPFGVEITFDGYEQNVFTEFLINDGYYCTVAKNIDAFFSLSPKPKYFQNKTIYNLNEVLLPSGDTSLYTSITNAYTSSNLNTLPYLTSSGAPSVMSFNTSSYSIIDIDPTNQFSIAFTDCQQPSGVSSILDFILYKAKIEEYLGSLINISYQDIINNSINQTAKPIMFVVEKYKDDILIQRFYLPNSGVVNFIDSQVIFGNTYKYVINSLAIVANLEYDYGTFDEFPIKPIPEYFQTLLTSNRTLKLVKNEIFTKEVTIYDNPPLAPDAQFYPVLNPASNENQIQMLLNVPVGSTKSVPILFNKTLESLFIEKSLKCQDVIDGQLLEYSTDDPPLAFLVHKKKIIPTKYEDFLNSTTTLVNVGNDTYSKVVLETLEPNVKYYYCFRTIDIHKQLSNPSSIFEVELVNDKGTYYPIIRPFEFPKENIEYNSISFKKYIHITPSLLQTTIDEQNSNLIDANTAFGKTIILGPQEDSLWGKKFKLRLMSKTTGKIIDFNLNFNKEHLVSEDEKNRVIT